jgi:hypothetical protein
VWWRRSRIETIERARHKIEDATVTHTDDARNAIDRAAIAVQQAQEGLDEMTSLTANIRAERLKNHFGQIVFDAMRPPK